MPTRHKLRYHIKLLRFRDWSVQSGVFLLGAFFADNFLAHRLDFIVASLTLSCLCLAYGYSLNEFFDDLKDKLVDDPRTVAELQRFIYVLLALALLLGWFISPASFAIVALIGVTVWLHSSPPFRLKRQLFWRFFLNSLGFGLFFLVGASLDNHLTIGETLMGVFIFGLYLPLELIHVLAHMDADRAKGLPTFALVHGERKTIALAITFLGALILYSASMWRMKFVSLAFAGWSCLHLSLLMLALLLFYKRNNSVETYTKLRFRTKIVFAIYGMGMLTILAGRF
jgi:4-hydroxybenzoate polyprenyltransferase